MKRLVKAEGSATSNIGNEGRGVGTRRLLGALVTAVVLASIAVPASAHTTVTPGTFEMEIHPTWGDVDHTFQSGFMSGTLHIYLRDIRVDSRCVYVKAQLDMANAPDYPARARVIGRVCDRGSRQFHSDFSPTWGTGVRGATIWICRDDPIWADLCYSEYNRG